MTAAKTTITTVLIKLATSPLRVAIMRAVNMILTGSE